MYATCETNCLSQNQFHIYKSTDLPILFKNRCFTMNVWITWPDYKENPDKLQVSKVHSIIVNSGKSTLYQLMLIRNIKALCTNQRNKLSKLSKTTWLFYKVYCKPEHCQHGNWFLWHLKVQDLIYDQIMCFQKVLLDKLNSLAFINNYLSDQ